MEYHDMESQLGALVLQLLWKFFWGTLFPDSRFQFLMSLSAFVTVFGFYEYYGRYYDRVRPGVLRQLGEARRLGFRADFLKGQIRVARSQAWSNLTPRFIFDVPEYFSSFFFERLPQAVFDDPLFFLLVAFLGIFFSLFFLSLFVLERDLRIQTDRLRVQQYKSVLPGRTAMDVVIGARERAPKPIGFTFSIKRGLFSRL